MILAPNSARKAIHSSHLFH